MLFWILCAITLYYLGLFLPPVLLIPRIGIVAYVGSRDAEPDPNVLHARAKRADRNLSENLPVFLALGVLSMIVGEADTAQALLGAQIFVLARVAYLPVYLMAVPWLRSGLWTVGWLGIVVMALALA